MKIKTVRRALDTKLSQWLSTIDDSGLRSAVRDNLLVSGGSIASMLLKEPVNDYDVYIKDMDVLVKLAEYYAPGLVLDGRRKEEYLKRVGEDDKYEDGENLSKLAVRYKNLHPDQVKLDVESAGHRVDPKIGEPIENEVGTYKVAFLSQNAISLTDDIQIVLRFHGDAEQIHKTFDFIHATNYFTFKEGLVTNIPALESLITKELKYQGSLYPLTSIIRMKKFLLRGWSMNAGEILKIMFQISELDLKDPLVLEEQLIGVDIAYFSLLIEALRGVPKEKITSAYMNEIINRVFNQYEGEV